MPIGDRAVYGMMRGALQFPRALSIAELSALARVSPVLNGSLTPSFFKFGWRWIAQYPSRGFSDIILMIFLSGPELLEAVNLRWQSASSVPSCISAFDFSAAQLALTESGWWNDVASKSGATPRPSVTSCVFQKKRGAFRS